jgi:hypothetical protein
MVLFPRAVFALCALFGAACGTGVFPMPIMEQSWELTGVNGAFPTTWVDSQTTSGLFIMSLDVSPKGQVSVVAGMPQQAGYIRAQQYQVSPSFPGTWIQQGYSSDYFVSHLAYHPTQKQWIGVSVQGGGFTQQAWDCNTTFPVDWLNLQMGNGLVLTAIAYGAGEWCLVMSNSNNGQKQEIYYNPTFPSGSVSTSYNDGMAMQSMTSGDDLWVVVMSTVPTGFNQYYYYGQSSFPSTTIAQLWPKLYSKNGAGYYVTNVGTDVAGNWFYVFTQFSVTFPVTFDSRSAWQTSSAVLNQVCRGCVGALFPHPPSTASTTMSRTCR